MRSQPANTHNKSPTTGTQLSSSAAGPKRCSHPSAVASPRCGFNAGNRRPIMTLVKPPSVLPGVAASTSNSGETRLWVSKATRTISEFPGSSVALRKLLPNNDITASVLLTAYGRLPQPYRHFSPLECQNRRLQTPRIFPAARRSVRHSARRCPAPVCGAARRPHRRSRRSS